MVTSTHEQSPILLVRKKLMEAKGGSTGKRTEDTRENSSAIRFHALQKFRTFTPKDMIQTDT